MVISELTSLLSRLKYKDWWFELGGEAPDKIWLRVEFNTWDPRTRAKYPAKGRKWLISQHMVKSEIVATAMKAVLTAEEHEARENFLYDDRAIFGPHIDVDALYWACKSVDVRPEPA